LDMCIVLSSGEGYTAILHEHAQFRVL